MYVVDVEDEVVLVFGNGIVNVLEEFFFVFFGFFVDLGYVEDFCMF